MRRDKLQRLAQAWIEARPGRAAQRAFDAFNLELRAMGCGGISYGTFLVHLLATGDLSRRAVMAVGARARERTAIANEAAAKLRAREVPKRVAEARERFDRAQGRARGILR